ncbi:hypothetical protein WDL1P1_00468 (plasmid) [Variovorax sp. WDL1]|nr:hypothetical protein CHC06_06037 [Variovorax sp. B2]PNG51286.1 hypothetical protein CHC07_05943 [Variovorax sp. B4]VTV17537.1 hypothetical protein WDL1P1_00468 [Variovorax sp. WDL1]
MPYLVDIDCSYQRRDPWEGFRTAHDFALLDAFRKGATLHLALHESPWRWFLRPEQGDEVLVWSGAPQGPKGQPELRPTMPLLLKELAQPVAASEGELVGIELGGWRFDAEGFARREREWSEVVAWREARRQNPTLYNPELGRLSAAALATLRLLKTGQVVYPYPELEAPLLELDAQGLLNMPSGAAFSLVPPARRLQVPRGPTLKLNFAG